jgi:hypothetical protein
MVGGRGQSSGRKPGTVIVDTPVAVAIVTGMFSVLVALIGKLMRSNRRDHDTVMAYLIRISRKLDRHLDDKSAHK